MLIKGFTLLGSLAMVTLSSAAYAQSASEAPSDQLGVAQVTGAALVISGLVATKKELVRDDAPISFNVAPMVADGGGGISLEGLF